MKTEQLETLLPGQWFTVRMLKNVKASSWLVLQGHEAKGSLRAKHHKAGAEVRLCYSSHDDGTVIAHVNDGIIREYSPATFEELDRDRSYPAWFKFAGGTV